MQGLFECCKSWTSNKLTNLEFFNAVDNLQMPVNCERIWDCFKPSPIINQHHHNLTVCQATTVDDFGQWICWEAPQPMSTLRTVYYAWLCITLFKVVTVSCITRAVYEMETPSKPKPQVVCILPSSLDLCTSCEEPHQIQSFVCV